MLAIAALTAATLRVARAQEVIPEVPPAAPPPEAVEPPPAAPPPPEETAPAPPEETAAPPPEPAPAPTAPPPAPRAPPASAAAEFGAKAQRVLSIDLPFMNQGPQFAVVHETSSMNGPSSTTIDVRPSVDYFVAPSFSIGAQLGIEHQSISSGLSRTTFSVEGRVGYAIPIADTVSLWPLVGLGLTYTRTTSSVVLAADTSTTGFAAPEVATTGYSVPLSLMLPFLWQPGGHFFVGGGPAFVTELVNKSQGISGPRTTEYGILALIGGTIGGG